MLPAMPDKALRVIDAIHAAGGLAYLVGGALRNLMLDRKPADWDFATTLTPGELLRILPGARLIGGTCGTVQAQFTADDGSVCQNETYEITPCREESAYTDGRHPDVVRFVPDILADLSRRDFTVNAMAWDGQVLFDPFGGQRDLKMKLLRCVGSPATRFAEDPLRVLRLFRLASQLGFTAEWNTFCAASEAMAHIGNLPRERVVRELSHILMGSGPQVLSVIVAKGGLQNFGFSFAPSLRVLGEVPAIPLCRWWAFIALCGADTATVCSAFGFSRRMEGELQCCNRLYRLGPALNRTALKMKLRNITIDYAPVAAAFAEVSPAFSAEPALFAEICAKREPYRIGDLAINGNNLAAEGIRGQQCRQVLDELLASVIKNPELNNVPTLLGIARGLGKLM